MGDAVSRAWAKAGTKVAMKAVTMAARAATATRAAAATSAAARKVAARSSIKALTMREAALTTGAIRGV